jgi:UDPglucose 6-dehydrogenase
MKVAVAGLWHLGSVTAACVAKAGIDTIGIDRDSQVVARLNDGEPPLFEPGLAELVQQGRQAGLLSFTTDATAVAGADVLWICYDTPVDNDDRADVDAVIGWSESLFPHLRDGAVVLVSAQLPVGTVARLERSFAAIANGRHVDFACSPENLRLGRAIGVFLDPGRIIIGVRNDSAREKLAPLLTKFCQNLMWMNVESAEMVKHALNGYLALSITFTNELAVIAERIGANAADIERALRSDPRVGPNAYVKAGPAFAGGTLARDVQFLSSIAEQRGLKAPLINSIIASNRAHGQWSLDQLRRKLAPLRGKAIAVLGLSYKPGTDAIRRSSSIELVRELLGEGAIVTAFDPAVRTLPGELDTAITLAKDARDALRNAVAVVVATEWPEFRELSADDFAQGMAGSLILDPAAFLTSIRNHPDLTVLSIGCAT